MKKTARSLEEILNGFDRAVTVALIILYQAMGNRNSRYPQGSRRTTPACLPYQAMGNTYSTFGGRKPYSDYPEYQQGFGRPTSAYSRYTGAGLGYYTHNSQAGNRTQHDRSIYIGRIRLAEVRGICYVV